MRTYPLPSRRNEVNFFLILCKVFAEDGFRRTEMKKDHLIGLLAVGLLSVLGFSSCSPKLRMRKVVDPPVDTLKVVPPDTIRFIPGPPDAPVKLMYGVPPARFKYMEVPEKELEKK